MVDANKKAASSSRRKIRRPDLAFWLEYPSLPACEIAALLGYQIAIFDMEHGVIPQDTADQLALACKKLGLAVYFRVASAERVAIQHALDSGVFIGPSDLSMTRGRGAFRATDKDFADFAEIAAAAAKAGKIWALPAPGRAVFDFASQHDAAFVTVCDDLSALRSGFAKGLAVAGDR